MSSPEITHTRAEICRAIIQAIEEEGFQSPDSKLRRRSFFNAQIKRAAETCAQREKWPPTSEKPIHHPPNQVRAILDRLERGLDSTHRRKHASNLQQRGLRSEVLEQTWETLNPSEQ